MNEVKYRKYAFWASKHGSPAFPASVSVSSRFRYLLTPENVLGALLVSQSRRGLWPWGAWSLEGKATLPGPPQ